VEKKPVNSELVRNKKSTFSCCQFYSSLKSKLNVYETFLFEPNIRQNAPLDILETHNFLRGACPQTHSPRIRPTHWFHPSYAPVHCSM